MKRRSFFRVVAATSVLPAAAQTGSRTAAEAGPPAAQPVTIEATNADSAAEPQPAFFTARQLASLGRLCEILMPPAGSLPGAAEAGVPPFLDFLIGASPQAVRQLYRDGLDTLDRRARERFANSFAALAAADADTLLAPLREPWTYDPPADPVARFLRQAKQDMRTATLNSREYVAQAARRRRSASGIGQYWHSLD